MLCLKNNNVGDDREIGKGSEGEATNAKARMIHYSFYLRPQLSPLTSRQSVHL